MQLEYALELRMKYESVDFVDAFNNDGGQPFSRLTFVMAVTKGLGLESLPTRADPIPLVLLALYASYVLLTLYPLSKVSVSGLMHARLFVLWAGERAM